MLKVIREESQLDCSGISDLSGANSLWLRFSGRTVRGWAAGRSRSPLLAWDGPAEARGSGLGDCAETAPPRHAKHRPAALAVAFRGYVASEQTPIAPKSASSLRPSMTSIPLPHFEQDVGEGIYQVLVKKLPLHSGTLTTGET